MNELKNVDKKHVNTDLRKKKKTKIVNRNSKQIVFKNK